MVRSRAQHLGTVVADTEKEAIREAIKVFDIPSLDRMAIGKQPRSTASFPDNTFTQVAQN